MLRPIRSLMQLSYNSVKRKQFCILTQTRSYCGTEKPKKTEQQSKEHSNEEKHEGHNYNNEEDEAPHKKEQQAKFLPNIRSPFENIQDKNRESYLTMLEIFVERDKHRRNHVEFIYAALKNMSDFGVEYDLEVYKALINVMPKGKFIPVNVFQAEFMHYPKQQQCIIDLLEQMEDYGVMPDAETELMLLNVFGRKGHPLRKYWRMMYWMPKFRNLSPWPLPEKMPDDVLELAKLAVTRMCTVDITSKVSIYDTTEIKEAIDQTWIVSGMSEEQRKLLERHPKTEALYIEGPFLIWLRHRTINYFTLRAEPNKENLQKLKDLYEQHDEDDMTKIHVPKFGESLHSRHQLGYVRSVHEQDDGTILAICATGTSTKDSLLSWIRLLESNGNANLGEIPILFRFRSKIGEKAEQIESGMTSTLSDFDETR